MKLFSAEFRRICGGRFLLAVLILLAGLTAILYAQKNIYQYLLYSDSFETYGFVSQNQLERELAQIVLERGDGYVTQADLDTLRERLPDAEKLEDFFQTNKECHTLGISSVADYDALQEAIQKASEEEDPGIDELYAIDEAVYGILEKADLLMEENMHRSANSSFQQLQKAFDSRQEVNPYIFESYSERQKARMEEILSGSMSSPLPSLVSTVVYAYAVPYTFFALCCLIFLFLPCVWSSRSRKVHLLQYTCREGRALLRAEFQAAAAIASLLMLIFVVPVFLVYAKDGIVSYWNLPLMGFLNDFLFYWVDFTLGGYISLLFLLWFITGLGLSLLSMCISRLCRNFTACVAFSLLLVVLAYFVWEWIFNKGFRLENPPWVETLLSVFTLLLGVFGAWFLSHREKRIDIS
ncbi:MAG: ABC transporter permease [Hydrogeniiclostridium sp.]